jgi:hypothetical protein
MLVDMNFVVACMVVSSRFFSGRLPIKGLQRNGGLRYWFRCKFDRRPVTRQPLDLKTTVNGFHRASCLIS